MGGNPKTDSCEYYDVNNNEWTQFAKLNEKKDSMSASILNNRFIYLFGGKNGNRCQNTIYKYDITDSQSSWVVLDLKLHQGLFGLNSIPISPTQILVFGGYDGGWYKGSYILNGDTDSISESIDMPQAPRDLIK